MRVNLDGCSLSLWGKIVYASHIILFTYCIIKSPHRKTLSHNNFFRQPPIHDPGPFSVGGDDTDDRDQVAIIMTSISSHSNSNLSIEGLLPAAVSLTLEFSE